MDKANKRGPQKVRLNDIAKLVGVSVNTVSGVLNPRSSKVRVAETTRRAILTAARKMHYRRNVSASKLAGGKTRTIAVLMSYLQDLFSAPVVESFEQEIAHRDYQCFIGCTRYDGLRKYEYIDRFLSYGVDGLLLTTLWQDDPEVKEALRLLLDESLPVVFLDYSWDEFEAPLVCCNHFQGGELLARHLHELGHKKLVYLSIMYENKLKSVRERLRAIQKVYREEGHASNAINELNVSGYEPQELVTTIRRHLSDSPDCTAIVVSNDINAYRLIYALRSAGLRVPEDIAVTGFDDIFQPIREINLAHYAGVLEAGQLTTIRQPFKEIGRKAAEVLLEQIENEEPLGLRKYLIDVELVVGDSSRLPTRPEALRGDRLARTRG